MLDTSGRATAIRLSMLAGAAALTLGGLTATAQAMPVVVPAPVAGDVTSVQYDGGGYGHPMHRYHRQHRYGRNDHPRHPGHAGVYDCGPGGKATRLSRKACGGNDRFQHMNRGY